MGLPNNLTLTLKNKGFRQGDKRGDKRGQGDRTASQGTKGYREDKPLRGLSYPLSP